MESRKSTVVSRRVNITKCNLDETKPGVMKIRSLTRPMARTAQNIKGQFSQITKILIQVP